MNETNKEKKPIYTHSPFQFEYFGVKVEADSKGKVKLTQDHEDGTFDEVNTSAGMIRRIYFLLKDGRTVNYENS